MGDASSILRLLLRRWPMLVLGVVLGIGGGILATRLMAPSYSSTSYVLVVPVRNADGTNAINYAQAYSRIATSQAVIQRALVDNGLTLEPGKVRQLVSVSASPDAPLIEITGRDRRPDGAARLTNVVAQGLSSYSNARAADTGYRVRQFTRALPATRPSSPNRTLNMLIGGTVGLLLAGLLALNLPSRRSSKSWQDVLNVYGYPVVAKVPRFKSLGPAPEEELSYAGVRSAATRLLERLQTGVGNLSGVLVVTSPHGGDGRTAISRLLFGLLGEQGRQVIYADAVRQRFLVAGHAEEFAAVEEQLSASGYAKILDGLRTETEVLIVDAPSLSRPADLRALLPLAEAVLVVVGDRNPGYRLQETLPVLDELAPPFVGIVLNHPGRRLLPSRRGDEEPSEQPHEPRVVAS